MSLRTIARAAYYRVVPDYVTLDAQTLPAKHLRLGGPEFRQDAFFLASARKEAQRLAQNCGFTSGKTVLDVGCGVGRLPIGIVAEFGDIGGYEGVDVDAGCIQWCNRRIAAKQPGFRFHQIDVLNTRYNPRGAAINGFRFPFVAEYFDVIYLYSVFSHMLTEDIRSYLAEFRRILKPNGILFFTAFIEEGVPDVEENPANYQMAWSGALHCVRYNRRFLNSLLATAGFKISRLDYGQETNGQSATYSILGNMTPAATE